MIKAEIFKTLAKKGVMAFKSLSKALENPKKHVFEAIERGSRSKFLADSYKGESGYYTQIFKTKDGGLIKKVYHPEHGTIDTALFRGDKVRYIRHDSHYYDILQPDHLVNSKIGKNSIFGSRYEVSITRPTEQANLLEVERAVHKPQITETLQYDFGFGAVNHDIYPSKLYSGSWVQTGITGGPVKL